MSAASPVRSVSVCVSDSQGVVAISTVDGKNPRAESRVIPLKDGRFIDEKKVISTYTVSLALYQ